MSDNTQVETYRAIDLSPDGEVVGKLLAGLPEETSAEHIRLTDHVGELPAGLTPQMASWYRIYIAGPRGQALDGTAAILGVNDDQKRTRGVFLERTISQEQDRRIDLKRQAQKSSREKRKSDYDRLDEVKHEYAKAKVDYDELRSRHGREAKLTPIWYIPLLILIGIAEMLINFESFSSIKAFTPAIALGVTAVVGFGIAYASHMHGTVIRQLEARFGAHRRDGDRASAAWMLTMGFFILFVVLGLVWYARNSLLSEQLLENAVIGGEAPSALFMIGGSMLGNVLVWLIGIVIAFIAHDEDHNFPLSLKHKMASEKKMYALHDKINQPLKRDFERIDAQCDKEIGQARNKQNSMSSDKSFAEGRAQFAKVVEQDTKVVAALELYRMQLTNGLKGKRVKIELPPEIEDVEDKSLDAVQYAAHPISLKYL
ncbi:uncharacterized membrane protein (DUF485 family) [Agrobacterium vitis]|nr:uncharacterized membrane protein (DUF485 family) [Agrobacterium vitis]MBE1438210.1 uncharacterized membrane protein (DUF485 family) [Agrobacterium vitis]